MKPIKDTPRSLVRIGFDGTVTKTFRGFLAEDRFANEMRVLQFLEQKGCPFVPRLKGYDAESLHLITTNVGQRVERMSREGLDRLFAELETYGVRHEDVAVRNVTMNLRLKRFCVIDFEFARILEPGHPEPPPAPPPDGYPTKNRG
jgi:tRNA A-37 threonylcarbamoyl transferase component Bud32